MTCNEVRPQLMDYSCRRLPAAEAGAIESHLSACAACRAVLAEETELAATLNGALAAAPSVSPRKDLWEVVRARQMALETMSAPRAAGSKRLLGPVLAMREAHARAVKQWTAALVAGVAAVVLMLAPDRPSRNAAQGARVLAQTMDSARQVADQSDDPMGDVSDSTWDALTVAGVSNTGTGAGTSDTGKGSSS